MSKESQTAIVMEGRKLKLEPVHTDIEVVTSKRFATIQMSLKVKEEALKSLKEKIKGQKSSEKKNILMDEFIQKKMKLNGKQVLSEGDYDHNWKSLKNKVFSDVL